jgi:Ala-tRNA(Pro) deacylase
MSDIHAFLERHHIEYERCDHPPVFTCEEAERLVPCLSGERIKNVFLRDQRGTRHFLVVVSSETRLALSELGKLLDAGRLSFGSAERLEKYLGVNAGAVSILGLINDPQHLVELVIDSEAWDHAAAFQCHPLVNTQTLVISKQGIETFLRATGHEARIMALPRS